MNESEVKPPRLVKPGDVIRCGENVRTVRRVFGFTEGKAIYPRSADPVAIQYAKDMYYTLGFIADGHVTHEDGAPIDVASFTDIESKLSRKTEPNRLASKDGKRQLYAVTCERIVKTPDGKVTVIPEIVHMHATDQNNARWIFNQDSDHVQNYRIVAIGPVIGFHVEDENGEKLRA